MGKSKVAIVRDGINANVKQCQDLYLGDFFTLDTGELGAKCSSNTAMFPGSGRVDKLALATRVTLVDVTITYKVAQ